MAGADRVSIIPRGNPNRPNRLLLGGEPRYITVHETANTATGADAEMHRRFVHNGGGSSNVSFHYVVDDHESIQLMPDNEVAWHAGDGGNGAGNNQSVAIEICVNAGSDWQQTIANTVKLVKHLMTEFGIPASGVVQHNHWSGKNCPTKLRANGGAGWRAFQEALQPAPEPPRPPLSAIESYWSANGGVGRYGNPLEPHERAMKLEDGRWYQVRWYERALLHWRAGEPVGEARVGDMCLKALVKLGEV